jgi:uncharacterized protein YndB with AHSA1/START domain
MNMINVMAVGGVVAAALAVAVMALPSSRTVERSAVVQASPSAVFALLSSNEGFQKFNPYRDADPNLHITLNGPQSGVGSSFTFKGKDGEGTQTITALSPDASVTMQLDLGPMGQPTTVFTLTPEAEGTRVLWRTEAAFGNNPIGRVVGVFLDGMMGPTYERGLQNLNRVLSAT